MFIKKKANKGPVFHGKHQCCSEESSCCNAKVGGERGGVGGEGAWVAKNERVGLKSRSRCSIFEDPASTNGSSRHFHLHKWSWTMMETIHAHQIKEGVGGLAGGGGAGGGRELWDVSCTSSHCILPSSLPPHTAAGGGEAAIIKAEGLLAAMCAPRLWLTGGRGSLASTIQTKLLRVSRARATMPQGLWTIYAT